MTKKKVKTPSSKTAAKTGSKLDITSLTFANINNSTATATTYSPATNIVGQPYNLPKGAKPWVKPPLPTIPVDNTGGVTPPKTTPGKGPFYYNMPMVKSAYFNPLAMPKAAEYTYETIPHPYDSGSWTTKTLSKPAVDGLFHFVDQGAYNDAKNAWAMNSDGSIAGGKGTLQMDRETNTTQILAMATQNAKKQKRKFDGNMYGFKFLYNPKEINMTWGAVANANPMYEAMGQDTFAPIAANMLSSQITFDIILNRIEDMSVLNPDGSYKGSNPYPGWAHPKDIAPQAERKKIVEMGTMYDMEYLFKAMHGYAGNSNFQSSLRGQTSDPGWLPVRPVELHLGNKLRYRVRVSSLSIRHAIFNSRMVPVLSTVSFTCNRYWDGIITGYDKTTSVAQYK